MNALTMVAEYGFLLVTILCIPAAIGYFFAWAISKNLRHLKLAGLALLIVVAGYVRVNTAEFWAIDSCIDRNGRWDAETKECRDR